MASSTWHHAGFSFPCELLQHPEHIFRTFRTLCRKRPPPGKVDLFSCNIQGSNDLCGNLDKTWIWAKCDRGKSWLCSEPCQAPGTCTNYSPCFRISPSKAPWGQASLLWFCCRQKPDTRRGVQRFAHLEVWGRMGTGTHSPVPNQTEARSRLPSSTQEAKRGVWYEAQAAGSESEFQTVRNIPPLGQAWRAPSRCPHQKNRLC